MTFNFRNAKSFTDRHGLFVALTGSTNSGKTFSAMRLARGIAGPTGKIAVLDSEGGRTLHLKDQFNFDVDVMGPPFRPNRFSEAAKDAEDAGYDVLVIDSFSQEWAGMGGVLDWHEEILQRRAGDDYKKRERLKMAAWIEPKMAHKSMVNNLIQRRMPIIFSIRGEETVKPGENGDKPQKIFKAICNKAFPFEITVSFRLATEARGIIDLNDPASYKMEAAHHDIFHDQEQISEEHGAALAAWARGETLGVHVARQPSPEERYPSLFGIKDGRQWLTNLNAVLAAAQGEDEVAEIGGLSSVAKTLGNPNAPDEIKREINAMLAEAMARGKLDDVEDRE